MKNGLFSLAFISVFWLFCAGPASFVYTQISILEAIDLHLKGPVKSAEIPGGLKTLYIFNRAGNIIELSAISNIDNRVSNKFVIIYDASGKKTGAEFYVEAQLKRKTVVNYDDRGNAVETLEYDADGKLFSKTTKKYDDKGNVLETTGKMEWGIAGLGPMQPIAFREVFKYDETGKLIEKQTFLAGEELPIEHGLFEYDKEGRLVGTTSFTQTFPGKPPRIDKHYYTYNKQGDVVEGRYYEPVKESNTEGFSQEFEVLDDKGTVKNGTLISDRPFMILWSITLCEYKYDAWGNWTEKACKGRGRDLKDFVLLNNEIYRRTITYYR